MDEIMIEAIYIFLIQDSGSVARVFNSYFIALQVYEALFMAPLLRTHYSLLHSDFCACAISLLKNDAFSALQHLKTASKWDFSFLWKEFGY